MIEIVKSPQLEDGFTRIANELLEAILGFGFTQRQLSLIFTVIRKTYGYGKKQDDMSAAQIGKICGMGRNHVSEVIGQLTRLNVLTRSPGTYGLVLGINKHHTQWCKEKVDSPKSGLVLNQDKTSPQFGQVDSPKPGHTKENLSKEKQNKAPRARTTFNQWIESCEQAGVLPIPEEDPIFRYACDIELPVDYIRLAWVEFKRKYGMSRKTYLNWNQHFQNAVRENWYAIWYEKEGSWQLTTRGKQMQKQLRGRE